MLYSSANAFNSFFVYIPASISTSSVFIFGNICDNKIPLICDVCDVVGGGKIPCDTYWWQIGGADFASTVTQ